MPVGIGLVQGTIQDFLSELAMKPHLNLKTVSDKKMFLLCTVSDVCSTDWPKKDSANFESQNFEGP